MAAAAAAAAAATEGELRALIARTRNIFPALPLHRPYAGDASDAHATLAPFGVCFDRARRHVFLTSHALVARTAAETAAARRAAAAAALATAACADPGCPSRRLPGSERAPLHLCARCRLAGYCGAGCQRAHWPAHKAQCKSTARTPAESAALAAADAARGGGGVHVDADALAFISMSSAAALDASGLLAALSWVWRKSTGYAGAVPSTARGTNKCN